MCDCIDQIDERLKPENSRLLRLWSINQSGGLAMETVALQTEKINVRNRRKMGAMASYCPFCGEKYKRDEGAVA